MLLLPLFGALTAVALRDRWFVPAMDREMARLCAWLAPASLIRPGEMLALVASAPATAAWTLLVGVVLVVRRRWPSAVLALAAIVAVTLIEAAIRVRIDQLPASPAEVVSLAIGRSGWAETYPSGHVARIALVSMLYPALLAQRVRPSWIVGALALSLVIGVERVVAGLHSGDEILGGALLGTGVALIALACMRAVIQQERASARPRGVLTPEPSARQAPTSRFGNSSPRSRP